MEYDWDVIVVGGGPAGLSAALRTRWIKRYKSIPCSTLIIENSHLGGLASWQGCMLTGPSWKLNKEEIIRHLMGDIEDLNIKVHQGRVTRIFNRGETKEVVTAEGRVFRSLAVIIATGIKVLINERDYLGKGLEVTSMGYEFMVFQLRKLLSRSWKPGLVVVGSPKLVNIIPLIRELNSGGSPLLFVMEEDGVGTGDVVRGWVERYRGNGHVEGIAVRTTEGIRDFPCTRVLLDFNSYELSPCTRLETSEDLINTPFIPVNSDMETSIPGILAAGDATKGGYNSFSRAISQGMTAGLSAYCQVYKKKFGAEPFLFAYRPEDFVLHADFKELPPFDDHLKPKALARKETIGALLGEDWLWLMERLDGGSSIGRIAAERGASPEALKEKLNQLVENKMITFHIEIES